MHEQDTDIHELTGTSPNFHTELAKQLQELVPEAVADGKVDVAKLKELLAEDAGDTNERFGLFWPGKKRAMRAAQDPTTATLKPAPELSKDWDTTQNIFIEGDNLEVLKVLQKQYHNSIKMIYIDPPYNTGKDFVYPDNFQEGLQNYLEFSKQVDEGNKKISTNTETAGRYHSNWLNMMYPRLKLARNLLTDDGVIFISIDESELDNLQKICNEIFGESNFLALITWQSGDTLKNDAQYFSSNTEHLLVYARNLNIVTVHGLPKTEEQKAYYKNPDNDPKGPYLLTPLHARSGGPNSRYEYTFSNGQTWCPPEGRYWAYSKDSLVRMDDEGVIKLDPSGVKVPQKKTYLTDVGTTLRPWTFWDYKTFGSTRQSNAEIRELMGRGIFDTPKPVKLMNALLQIGSDSNAIVLDFFSGSGTMAHAVMQLNAEDCGNRKHIQVQLPEPTDEKSEAYKAGYRKISDIARERINRAGEKIKADYADKLAERDSPLDVGYRTYQLSDTNFRKWQSSATADLGELQARLDLMRESADDSASEADLLVEVMLKMGLPLTSRTEIREVAGLHVHQVVPADEEHADVQPVFYLNEHVKPTLEQLRAIVTELTPSKFVILDDAFQGDNQLKTNLVQTCKSYDVELWTV